MSDKALTVREFIDVLSTMPQDSPVYIDDWNEGWAPPEPLQRNMVKTNDEDNYPDIPRPHVMIG